MSLIEDVSIIGDRHCVLLYFIFEDVVGYKGRNGARCKGVNEQLYKYSRWGTWFWIALRSSSYWICDLSTSGHALLTILLQKWKSASLATGVDGCD